MTSAPEGGEGAAAGEADGGEAAAGPAVAVVVVNHNTRDDLLACLDSLADAGADEILVVDSGSSDGSAEAAAARPGVRCIALDNVGFGQAANAGVAQTGAEVLILANADTRFKHAAARALGEYLQSHPDVGAVGPRIRFPDGRVQLSVRAFPSLRQAIGHALLGLWWPANPWTRAYRLTDWDHDREGEVDWVSGCCIAVRRAAFEQLGGFDAAYFMFVEDVDLCYRLWQAGWKVAYAPVTEVIHDIGGAVSRRRYRMIVEHARSLDRFFGRRYAGSWRRLARPLIRLGLVGWVLAAAAWTLARGKTHAHA